MPIIPQFVARLDRAKSIHQKKNDDYAGNSNPFENFERAALLITWFNDPVDKAFVSLIGTKLARLATLLNKKESPNNESISDSFDDLMIYCGLWGSYREFTSQPQPIESIPMEESIFEQSVNLANSAKGEWTFKP